MIGQTILDLALSILSIKAGCFLEIDEREVRALCNSMDDVLTEVCSLTEEPKFSRDFVSYYDPARRVFGVYRLEKSARFEDGIPFVVPKHRSEFVLLGNRYYVKS